MVNNVYCDDSTTVILKSSYLFEKHSTDKMYDMMIRWQSLLQMVLRQLGNHMWKNNVESLPHTIYKNYLKMDQRPK